MTDHDTFPLAAETMGRPGATVIERAGHRVLERGFNLDSGFTPGTAIWTQEHTQELVDHFVNAMDVSGASFNQKLRKQMEKVSEEGIQLFAELYYLSLLPLADYKGSTKRSLINSVLQLASRPIEIPEDLDRVLDGGVFNGGVAFKTRRYWQLAFLVEFAAAVVSLTDTERRRLLEDPLAFRDFANSASKVNAPSQLNGLNYLAFPKYFLPIANTDHRKRVRDAFIDRIDSSSGDLDVDLKNVNDVLTEGGTIPVDYYLSPWREHWHPKEVAQPGPAPAPSPAEDAWSSFVRWVGRFAESINLDRQERDYKIEMAERVSAAMEAAVEGDPTWAPALKKALNTNLLPTFFKISLYDDLDKHPVEVRQALLEVWGSPAPDPITFDVFKERLRGISGGRGYTPGNATALGSVLLMARDWAEYPPYRPTPVQSVLKLTGTAPLGSEPSERYATLLNLCDELIERAGEAGIEVRDRLDAQSLLWTVVQYEPPKEWPEAERSQFLSWRGDVPPEDEPTRKAWLVRGSSVNGLDLVPTWLEKGSVSLAASKLREVEPGLGRDELKEIVDEDYTQTSYAAKAAKVDEFHAFLTRMQVGDLVCAASQGRLFVGTIAGPAAYLTSEDGRSNLRRAVDWGQAAGVDYSDLPGEVTARLQIQYDVVEMTQQLEVLESLLSMEYKAPTPPPVRDLVLPDATPALADRLNLDEAWLQECIELLRDRPQLIFYGPPGTGKTFIAQHLAAYLAGDRVRLVQFHPAYSYEDFFEGYRPEEGGGFALRPGPMRKVVDLAKEDPSTPHFLIIDEINRGNLAKVFGELYFLLEYRDQNVDLLYATDDDLGFTLPKNVFIIGTMNTADRSIALVDAAMRRRFAFVSMHPAEVPISGVLRQWLDKQGLPSLAADLLDALNSRIEDPDFKIGPSYFMRSAVHEDGGLERAWRTAILPLLEEHHYGDDVDVRKRYGLDTIRALVQRTAAVLVTEEGATADEPAAAGPS